MGLLACLILAYGPLNWSLPWWIWALSVVLGPLSISIKSK